MHSRVLWLSMLEEVRLWKRSHLRPENRRMRVSSRFWRHTMRANVRSWTVRPTLWTQLQHRRALHRDDLLAIEGDPSGCTSGRVRCARTTRWQTEHSTTSTEFACIGQWCIDERWFDRHRFEWSDRYERWSDRYRFVRESVSCVAARTANRSSISNLRLQRRFVFLHAWRNWSTVSIKYLFYYQNSLYCISEIL